MRKRTRSDNLKKSKALAKPTKTATKPVNLKIEVPKVDPLSAVADIPEKLAAEDSVKNFAAHLKTGVSGEDFADNPGRRSTYRRRDSGQTIGTSALNMP